MSQRLALIGTDINGAFGSSCQFANHGATVTACMGADELPDSDVSVLITNSKQANPKKAYLRTRKAIRRCHGRYIYLQEDSSLRGHLSFNLQAVIDELNPPKIVVCISLPDKKRHVEGGTVFIDGVRADRSTAAKDPLFPIKEAHIPTIIYRDIGVESEVIGVDTINEGPEALSRKIQNSKAQIIVLDALEKQHFVNIAATIKSSGDKFFTVLTNSLSRHLPSVHGYSEENCRPFKSLRNEKPVLVVIGSYDKVIGRQLYEANREEGLDIIPLETKGLLSMRRRICQMKVCSGEAMRILENDRNVVITTNDCKYIPQLRHKMAYLLADMAVELMHCCKPGALLTAGSDTNYAICSRLQAESIDVLGSIRLNASTIITRIYTKNGGVVYMGSRGGALGELDEITSALKVLRPVS